MIVKNEKKEVCYRKFTHIETQLIFYYLNKGREDGWNGGIKIENEDFWNE